MSIGKTLDLSRGIDSHVTLNDHTSIPILGLGTYKMVPDSVAAEAVRAALDMGYRHIDTASIYENERGVGEGIRASGLAREDVFLTTKVWNTDQGYDATCRSIEASLSRLQTDYVDLYLIHWPKVEHTTETWRAMCEFKQSGKLRSIGVCNFNAHHLEPLLDTEVIPSVNQIELHPQFPQLDLRAFCAKHNIMIQGWAPLIRGKVYTMKPIQELAAKYNKSPAQIAIRWQIQQGIIAFPKTVNPDRMRSNSEIFDFELSAEDFKQLEGLAGEREWADPDNFDF